MIDKLSQEKWLEKISSDPTIKMFGVCLAIDPRACIAGGGTFIPITEYFREYDFISDHIPYKGLGVAGFTSIDLLNRKAEFSLYIAPEFQGQGFGRNALWLLLRHGFLDWGFHRIYGEVFDNNHAIDMFIKLGMKKEGTMRGSYMREGKMIDSHIVSMIKPEFDSINLKV